MDLSLTVHVPATVQDMTEALFQAFAVNVAIIGYIFTPKWAGNRRLSALPHPQTIYCRNSFPSNFAQDDQSGFFSPT